MAEYNPSKIIKDGNTYNFRDTTKIPLAGSNAISGSLIPATDNSIDVGSSTNNIKMLYTKGITIDSKAIDTDADSNMTYDGHIVDTIEEQGNGYIRYSNGLQICYGEVVNDNNIENGKARFSFPKAFSASPNLVATPDIADFYLVTCKVESGTTWVLSSYQLWGAPNIGPAIQPLPVNYVAIGKWN